MRTVWRIAVIGVLLVLLLVVAVAAYSHWLKRSADKVVRVSYELSQRESTPTIEDLRHGFGTELRQSAARTTSGCGYEVILSNGILSKLRLAPYTVLS